MHLISTALADPARYRAFEMICNSETITSCEIARTLQLTPPTISHHLKQLRDAELVDSVRDGRLLFHTANLATLNSYVEALTQLAQNEEAKPKSDLEFGF